MGTTSERDEIIWLIENCRITGTVSLDLSCQGIKKLPAEIEGLKNLKALNLSNNEFRSLPEWLFTLTNLRELDISRNFKLKSMPDNFSQLCNLESLNIVGTAPGKFPESVREIKQLKNYLLTENMEFLSGLAI